MSSHISILAPEPTDYQAFAQLETEVFSDDPISVFSFGPSRLLPAALSDRASSLARRPSEYDVRIRKAVTPEGRIVGYSYWKFYSDVAWLEKKRAQEEADRVRKEELKKAGKEEKSTWPPKGANAELCEKVFGEQGADGYYFRSMAGRAHAALNILVVLAEFQGQGVGKALIQDGLVEADKSGLPVWLASTEPAVKFYQASGFVIDDVLLFDMKPYGGTTVEKHTPMVREGQPKKIPKEIGVEA